MKLTKLYKYCVVGSLLPYTCLGMKPPVKRVSPAAMPSMCECLKIPADQQNYGIDAQAVINEKIDYLMEKLNLNTEPPVYPSIRAKIAQICRKLEIPCVYEGADQIFDSAVRIEAEKRCAEAGIQYLYEGADVNEALLQISDIYLKIGERFFPPEFFLDELIKTKQWLYNSMWSWINIWFPNLTDDLLKGYLDGTEFLPSYVKPCSDGIILSKRIYERKIHVGVNENCRISYLFIPFIDNDKGNVCNSGHLFFMKGQDDWDFDIPTRPRCMLPFYCYSRVMSVLADLDLSSDSIDFFPVYYRDALFLKSAPSAFLNSKHAYQEAKQWASSMYPANLSKTTKAGRYKFFQFMPADDIKMLFKYDKNWCLAVSQNSFGWVCKVKIYKPNFEVNENNLCKYFLGQLGMPYKHNRYNVSILHLCPGGLEMSASFEISIKYLYVSGLDMEVHFLEPLRNQQLKDDLRSLLGKDALKILEKLK